VSDNRMQPRNPDPVLGRAEFRGRGVSMALTLLLFAVLGPPIGAAMMTVLIEPTFLSIYFDPEVGLGAAFITFMVGGPAAVLTGGIVHFWSRREPRLWLTALVTGAVTSAFSPWVIALVGGGSAFRQLDLSWRLAIAGAVAAILCAYLARRLGLIRPATPPAGMPA